MELEALESLEQRAQRLVLSCKDGIGGTTMLWCEGLLHYFLLYVWHCSLPHDGGEWKVCYFNRESEALESLEQCAQRLVLSCTAGIGGTTMLWSGELCGCEDVARV